MLNEDEDALQCDLMETYGIYDMKALPLSKVALFSCGLRDGSRIKMKLTKQKLTLEQVMLASVVDRLSYLVWFQTEDGHKGRNKPVSLLSTLTNGREKKDNVTAFESGSDFDEARLKLLEKG